MSSVVVRKIGSVPSRTATETWHAIVELLAAPGSAAESELLTVAGIASMLIADENLRGAPLVVIPETGARVRVYTIHGDDTDDVIADEAPLATWPTNGSNWTMSIPCDPLDLAMATAALESASHVCARDAGLGVAVDEADLRILMESTAPDSEPRVDTSWLSR